MSEKDTHAALFKSVTRKNTFTELSTFVHNAYGKMLLVIFYLFAPKFGYDFEFNFKRFFDFEKS